MLKFLGINDQEAVVLVGGSRPPRGPTAFQLAAFASEKHPDVFSHAWIGRPGAEGAELDQRRAPRN